MGDGNNDNVIFLDVVNHTVREAMSLATASVFAERMPGLWEGLDSLDRSTYLISELSPQTGTLTLVIRRCLPHVGASGFQEGNLQVDSSSSKTSSAVIDFIRPA